ncbi:MAG: M23 family metallopeptidase [bacterium]|nr:M23 family metallopeptidase [bacterium]MYB24690.1 M23 family metallopeptidase [Acidimicrobiia bacterium]
MAAPASAQTAAAPAPVPVVYYQAPTDGIVVDPFRPPAHPGAPGNRGLEYATRAGSDVRAAAAGVVSFAGRVADGLHVTVAHADGVRTSYSFLASVAVDATQRVEAGQVVGTSGGSFHFGARIGKAYVDPAVLLGDLAPVRLVPLRGRWVPRRLGSVGAPVPRPGWALRSAPRR